MTKAAAAGAIPAADQTLENMDEVLTLADMARISRLSINTIRQAIKRGELQGFLPGNRDPRKTGRGLGYRALRRHFQAWFFGANRGGS